MVGQEGAGREHSSEGRTGEDREDRVRMDWHKELERSLSSQGESSIYDSAQYSAAMLQVAPLHPAHYCSSSSPTPHSVL